MHTIDTKGSQEATSQIFKYFGDSDLFELFEFDVLNCMNTCETLNMLLNRDGFKMEMTPTLDQHIPFLRGMEVVKGLTLNSNLYSKLEKGKKRRGGNKYEDDDEEEEEEEEEDYEEECKY